MSKLLFDAAREYCEARIRSEETRAKYMRAIRQFSNFLERPATLDDLTNERLTKFLEWIVSMGNTPRTANDRAKCVSTIWAWCHRAGLVGEGPLFVKLDEPLPQPIRKVDPAPIVGNSPVLLDDLVTDYFSANLRGLTVKSQKLYRGCVKRFAEFLGRPPRLDDLSELRLADFCRHRRAAGKALATVDNEAKKIAALWNWAASRGMIARPNIKISCTAPRTPKAWSGSELRRLFCAAAEARGYICGGPTSILLTAKLRLAWDTGERVSAIQQLLWSDINGRVVCFRAATRKGAGRSADNVQRLSRKTLRALKALREVRPAHDPFVLPQVHSQIWYNALGRILDEAGLENSAWSKFHRLRRTHATFLHLAGGDATAALGHSSDAVTRAHYLDPTQCHRGYGADLLNGFRGIAANWLRRMWRLFQLRA